ncbi:hypothetical protein [Sphingomonas sp. FUKUSWIS1]|uniref:hypothetical protein n=1 Tax=Sphingomonas sp. FUKUSWIS1 TaxID=1379701 RepID=UPI0012696BE8|nr:hypothetical protein [Sphingomonas sp. FUKUSWIS1]
MLKSPFWAMIAGCGLSGCALLNTRAVELKPGSDRLLIWKSNYSAGLSGAGGTCAQGALTANATSLKAAAKGEGATTGNAAKGSGELSFGQQQAIAMLNASNAQTAYANIAFFYLCQISSNYKGVLTADQVIHMWDSANKAVTIVSTAGAIASTISSSNIETTTKTVEKNASDSGSDTETPTDTASDSGAPKGDEASTETGKPETGGTKTVTTTAEQPATTLPTTTTTAVMDALKSFVAEPSPVGNSARSPGDAVAPQQQPPLQPQP